MLKKKKNAGEPCAPNVRPS